MMIVHIVIRSDWRSDSIAAVYSNKQAAEEHAARINKPGIHGSVVTKEIQDDPATEAA